MLFSEEGTFLPESGALLKVVPPGLKTGQALLPGAKLAKKASTAGLSFNQFCRAV